MQVVVGNPLNKPYIGTADRAWIQVAARNVYHALRDAEEKKVCRYPHGLYVPLQTTYISPSLPLTRV